MMPGWNAVENEVCDRLCIRLLNDNLLSTSGVKI